MYEQRLLANFRTELGVVDGAAGRVEVGTNWKDVGGIRWFVDPSWCFENLGRVPTE